MDVILLAAIEQLGAEGAVVQVKPGYARNYLLPRGLAVIASPEQLEAAQAATQQRARATQRVLEQAQALKQQIESRTVTAKLTLGQDGKPFGSVTTHDLVELLHREGLVIEKHAVRLEQPLKALGVYDVPIKLHPNVTATLKLWVATA